MSLFFEGEQDVPVADPDPVDLDKALVAVSKRLDPHEIAAAGGIDVDQARALVLKCRTVEPLLTTAVSADTVRDEVAAAEFVTAATDKDFPADTFVAIVQARVDASATWADVAAAYKKQKPLVIGDVLPKEIK
jgi:hypothetical protein